MLETRAEAQSDLGLHQAAEGTRKFTNYLAERLDECIARVYGVVSRQKTKYTFQSADGSKTNYYIHPGDHLKLSFIEDIVPKSGTAYHYDNEGKLISKVSA